MVWKESERAASELTSSRGSKQLLCRPCWPLPGLEFLYFGRTLCVLALNLGKLELDPKYIGNLLKPVKEWTYAFGVSRGR